MKIGLLGLEDPADIRTYSGTSYHLSHYLRLAGHEVRPLGPYPVKRIRVRIEDKILRTVTGKKVIQERHPALVRQYSGIVNQYVEQHPDLDLLLAPGAFLLSSVRTKLPTVIWGDTTFAGVLGRYGRYHNLSERTIAQCHAAEQGALSCCDMAIFSSQWAADVAQASYSMDPAKLRVITYGANMLETPTEAQFRKYLAQRDAGTMKLLLMGVDWERKGVEKAIATVAELRRRGFNATLEVAGCSAPAGRTVPDYVTVLGMISKRTPEGWAKLSDLMGGSHLLILPTVAECAAVVLAEANAFGLPFLTTDVGGNASLVRAGVNGDLLHLDATAEKWADAAERFAGNGPSAYEEAAWRAFRYFHQELSWERAVARFEDAVKPLISTKPSHEHDLAASLR